MKIMTTAILAVIAVLMTTENGFAAAKKKTLHSMIKCSTHPGKLRWVF